MLKAMAEVRAPRVEVRAPRVEVRASRAKIRAVAESGSPDSREQKMTRPHCRL